MKILVYSDVHLKKTCSYAPWNKITETGLTKNLKNQLKGLEFVAKMIDLNNPDFVFNLGDFFDKADVLDGETLIVASKGLGLIKDSCDRKKCDHYYLTGNHDILSNKNGMLVTEIIKPFFDFYIDSPSENGDFGFIPYTYDMALIEDSFKSFKNKKVIFTHLDFQNAKYESGIESKSLISSKVGTRVISGDLHLPDQVNDVVFVGSLIQNTFSNNQYNGNGVLIYDTETDKFDRIPNTLSKHFIKLKDSEINNLTITDKMVYKVITEDKKSIEGFFKNNEEVNIIEKKTNKNEESVVYLDNNFDFLNPDYLLKEYLQTNNPMLVHKLEEVFKKG